MTTKQRRLAKRVTIGLALVHPFGVLLMFAVNAWVKAYLGVEVDWRDEMVKSFYGTAILLVSCLLLWLGFWKLSVCITRRCI